MCNCGDGGADLPLELSKVLKWRTSAVRQSAAAFRVSIQERVTLTVSRST
jgi:hypothetical protein